MMDISVHSLQVVSILGALIGNGCPAAMSKQATLFRAWGSSKSGDASRGKGKAPAPLRNRPAHTKPSAPDRAHHRHKPGPSAKTGPQAAGAGTDEYGFEGFDELDHLLQDYDADDLTEVGSAPLAGSRDTASAHNASLTEDTPGFSVEAGQQWIYPTNYPIRDYQFNIVQKCLFQNTLVCLPTGLGKTFIAAVVMYNYHRWYPEGKVVFLAPTKPLVSQQIEACHSVMGIPQEHLAEMTGKCWRSERGGGGGEEEWSWRERGRKGGREEGKERGSEHDQNGLAFFEGGSLLPQGTCPLERGVLCGWQRKCSSSPHK